MTKVGGCGNLTELSARQRVREAGAEKTLEKLKKVLDKRD